MGKPKIRFKGYEEDWEQRKFGDFTWDAGKRNKENLDLVPYAITNEHGFISQSEAHDEFGYMKDTDRRAYNIVEPNSFAYNPARINVGSLGYYEGTENVIVSSLYEVFKTAEYVDDRFLWHWLKSPELTKWIGKLQEGSVRLYFYYDKLCECVLQMPSIEEQRKISKYLDSLEHLITLHQRKYEETKKLKKYMLQKMFPQNEKKVPEIRFSRYTEDWEQRKFTDIVTEKLTNGVMNRQSESPSDLKHINVINMYTPDKIHVDDLTDSSWDESAVKKCNVQVGDIFLTRSSLKPEGIAEANVLLDSGRFVFDDHLIKMRVDQEQYDPFFVKVLLSTKTVKNQFIAKSKQNAFTTIGQEDIAGSYGVFPVKGEQKKIGIYFQILDHLITLHQHKCEELRKIKKYMLQNMFV